MKVWLLRFCVLDETNIYASGFVWVLFYSGSVLILICNYKGGMVHKFDYA